VSRNEGSLDQWRTSVVSSAAPVGVTSSASMSGISTGAPRSSSAVAGAGTGINPCSERTAPRPSLSGEAYTSPTPSARSASAVPTTSTSASTAPTS
jgi:hypothetical protein